MGTLARYLYIVRMDVDPEQEPQFNAWYNDEHIPALLQVPGVLGAYRYFSVEGTPKYTAIYELENPHVRTSDAWKRAVEQTRRPPTITVTNLSRNLCERIDRTK